MHGVLSIVSTINKLNTRGNAGVVAGTSGQTDWAFGVIDTMQDWLNILIITPIDDFNLLCLLYTNLWLLE